MAVHPSRARSSSRRRRRRGRRGRPHAALTPRTRRAEVTWSRASSSARARASGRRAGSPRRSATMTRPDLTSRTRLRRGATPAAAPPPSARREAPGWSPSLRQRGVDFDRDADGQPLPGARGRPFAAASGPCRRRRHGSADHRAPRCAGRGRARDRGREGSSAGRPLVGGGRCHGVVTDAGQISRRRHHSRYRRRRRAVGADDEPVGRDRSGNGDRACGRRRGRRPGALPVPSDRPRGARTDADGLLVTEAVRGEGAMLLDAKASASPTSSRRATSSPSPSSTGWRPTKPTTCCSTSAASARTASRTSSRRWSWRA